MPQAQTYQSEFTGVQMDERFRAVATLAEALTVLEQAIAAKYTKPANGIPSTDMDADVQNALALALTSVQSLADYYTKSEVDQLLAAINGMDYVDVATLPTASASTMGKIYLVGPDGSGYYAYYYTSYDGSAYSWVGPLGTTQISLANYATKAELSQLDQEVDTLVANMKVLYNALGAGAFWGNKPVIDWGGEDVPVIRNLTHCTCDNVDDSVRIGDSYYAEVTPDSGYILGSVLCSMGGTSVSVVNGVIDIDEVTGPITITASGINLDSVAFDGKTYKQIFETNNALGISPGFENGSYSPMTVNAGSPTITTEDVDSGTYSLKASGTSSAQVKTGNKSGAAFIACRVKVTSYVQGSCGCQYNYTAGVNRATDGWETAYQDVPSASGVGCYVGSFNSANLTGYVDTPVVILKSIFSTAPTFDEFKALYDRYVSIKKAE